ncbi:hypothetical protein [Streptomyces sp. NPDC005423]|uniref:hypothetical protein n=1 Tax=Streptomyces sp. NPDC005423 TaxID=3155343 RepID=UPI0033BB4BF9
MIDDGSSRAHDAELLLARISAAAGRAGLGRRRATYRASVAARGWRVTDLRQRAYGLLRGGGTKGTTAGARLDLYEHGMTVVLGGRIRVVRYDTTVARRRGVLSSEGVVRACALVDVEGEWLVLRRGGFDRPEAWAPEIRRAVTHATVARALAALAQGARLTFGPVWVTEEEVGHGSTSLRWTHVQRSELRNGSVAVRVAGRWQVLGSLASGIPDPVVLHALAERLSAADRDDD